MPSAIDDLKPELVWKYFARISRIPRCSGQEAAITRYILEAARELNLKAKADRAGNVVVRKPASAGREQARSAVLQSHLDMVCEKNKDKVHDFRRDPIEIVREGDVLVANGTTLGADNGIGVATMLAVMEDASLEHGPLEFLFTVDEETGLTGANNLEPGFVEGKTLMNLDSEEEGHLYVGCSGGRDTVGSWDLLFEDPPEEAVAGHLSVKGLRGGHSGLEIDKGRGNAIKLLNRLLLDLDSCGVRVAAIEGGNKRNAIPREAEAVVFIPQKRWDAAASLVSAFSDALKDELGQVEPGAVVDLSRVRGKRYRKVIRRTLQKKICQALAALPHGVIRMSSDIPGLVETSTNVGVIRTSNNAITVSTSQRSSIAGQIADLSRSVACIFQLAGASVEHSAGYPGWKPNLDSAVLRLSKETYQHLYGVEPQVKAIHAGLECGIIGEKYPGMDMISFGPTLEGVHSPDERIYVSTVEKFWAFLVALMARL